MASLHLLERRPYLPLVGPPLRLAVSIVLYGFPSFETARAAYSCATGFHWADYPKYACNFLIGDVWIVWATVFHQRVFSPALKTYPLNYRGELPTGMGARSPHGTALLRPPATMPMFRNSAEHSRSPASARTSAAGGFAHG